MFKQLDLVVCIFTTNNLKLGSVYQIREVVFTFGTLLIKLEGEPGYYSPYRFVYPLTDGNKLFRVKYV